VSTANRVDVDRTDTWTRYRKGLCAGCAARCCTMPVEVRVPDLLRLGLVEPFEAEHETPAAIARRLQRAGIVRSLRGREGGHLHGGAERRLAEAGRKKKKDIFDAQAATVILQNHLNQARSAL
jgi:hypothetical protein